MHNIWCFFLPIRQHLASPVAPLDTIFSHTPAILAFFRPICGADAAKAARIAPFFLSDWGSFAVLTFQAQLGGEDIGHGGGR
jgi:hypothetical protein